MNVLLSVKPKYAEKILDGEKKYEFRRSIFRRNDVEKVYIYSSSPVSKIVAVFKAEKILEGSPKGIWEQCQEYAGISKDDFFAYFKNSSVAFAIEIGAVDRFHEPIDPFIIENFKPPQSFYYVPASFFQDLWDAHSAELIKPAFSTESISEVSFIRQL